MNLQSRLAAAFIASCRAEIMALKPGNVHVFAEGHGMNAEQFLASAEAAAPALTEPGLPIGQRIRGAVDASFDAVGLNTNLGIVLLCAPLAATAEKAVSDLRPALAEILANLTQADAAEAFAAIARASPGGLGAAACHDVRQPATTSLWHAMAEAAPRDRIAFQYVSNFEDVFMTGLPALATARTRGMPEIWAVVAVYLVFLSKFADSHIHRKFGPETAEAVRQEAADTLTRFAGYRDPADSFSDLLAFDSRLKAAGHNPGTSADLTVATLFADHLASILLQRVING